MRKAECRIYREIENFKELSMSISYRGWVMRCSLHFHLKKTNKWDRYIKQWFWRHQMSAVKESDPWEIGNQWGGPHSFLGPLPREFLGCSAERGTQAEPGSLPKSRKWSYEFREGRVPRKSARNKKVSQKKSIQTSEITLTCTVEYWSAHVGKGTIMAGQEPL